MVAERCLPEIRIASSCFLGVGSVECIWFCHEALGLWRGDVVSLHQGGGEAVGLTHAGLNSSSLIYSEEVKDRERWRLPSFLRCVSWSRRSWRKDHKAKAANNIHEGMPSSLTCTPAVTVRGSSLTP